MSTEGPNADTAGFRLSPQQEQLWHDEPDGPRLTATCLIDVGDSDPSAVREALDCLVERDGSLRVVEGVLGATYEKPGETDIVQC